MLSHRKPDICFTSKNQKSFSFINNKAALKFTEVYDKCYFIPSDSNFTSKTLTIDTDRDSDKVITYYLLLKDKTGLESLLIQPEEGIEIIWLNGTDEMIDGKNYIIQFSQINKTTILASLTNSTLASNKEKLVLPKYGVLLTLETTTANETVHYHEIDSTIKSIKFYWDYESEDNLGKVVHENYHTYNEPGVHKLLVLSDTDLQFPQHITNREKNDISQHLTQIDKYKESKPLLIKKEKSTWCYFAYFEKLRKINTDEIFDQNITSFNSCFLACTSLIEIPTTLFYNNEQATKFDSCFYACKGITEIPATLFYNNKQATIFTYCFYHCYNITSDVPDLWNTHSSADGNYCFNGCENASNYTQIPDDWK